MQFESIRSASSRRSPSRSDLRGDAPPRAVPTRAEIASSFDRIATEFDATRQHPWPETFLFASLLPPGSKVLDLGCGNARNWEVFRERGHAVVGLDASRKSLKRGATRIGTRSIIQGDAVYLPVRSSVLDAIHCVAVIHHLPSERERLSTAEEIGRVLRPQGTVLLSAWAFEQKRFANLPSPDVTVPWRRTNGPSVPRFYHLFRAGELEELATSARLEISRAWREGDNHVVLASKT